MNHHRYHRKQPILLPYELAALIVDELIAICKPRQRQHALINCSLISYSLWIAAREHLFSVVNIKQNLIRDGPRRLGALLTCMRVPNGLSISFIVQKLSITFDLTLFESVLDDGNGTFADILNCLEASCQMTQFSFCCTDSPGLNWVNVSTYLHRAIRKCMKIGTLTHFSIKNVYNLPMPFFHGASFTNLAIAGTSYRPSPMVPMFTASGDLVMTNPDVDCGPPPLIVNLSLNGDDTLMHFMPPSEVPFTHLSVFNAKIVNYNSLAAVRTMFARASQAIEHCTLTLDPRYTSSRWTESLPDFNILQRLRILEIIFPIATLDDRNTASQRFAAIATLLDIHSPIQNTVEFSFIIQANGSHTDIPNSQSIDGSLANGFARARSRKIVYQLPLPHAPEVASDVEANCSMFLRNTFLSCLDPQSSRCYSYQILFV